MGIVLKNKILKTLMHARLEGLDDRQAAKRALGAVLQRHPEMDPTAARAAIDQVRSSLTQARGI